MQQCLRFNDPVRCGSLHEAQLANHWDYLVEVDSGVQLAVVVDALVDVFHAQGGDDVAVEGVTLGGCFGLSHGKGCDVGGHAEVSGAAVDVEMRHMSKPAEVERLKDSIK